MPLVHRPRKSRIISYVAAVAVVVVFAFIATGLHGPTGEGPGYFQRGDQFAMVGLGVLGAAGILLFARPRVEADAEEIRVRNVVGSYVLPWTVIRKVTFGRGSSWLTLELHDDDVLGVMAIQMTDKEHAVRAARTLRALHAAATQPAPTS